MHRVVAKPKKRAKKMPLDQFLYTASTKTAAASDLRSDN